MSAVENHNCVNITIANIPGHLRIWPLVNCHRHGEQVEKQDEEPFHKKSLHLIVLAIFWCAIWTISCKWFICLCPFIYYLNTCIYANLCVCGPLLIKQLCNDSSFKHVQVLLLGACANFGQHPSLEDHHALANNCLEDVLENCTHSPCRISMMADPQLVEPSDMMESRAPRG